MSKLTRICDLPSNPNLRDGERVLPDPDISALDGWAEFFSPITNQYGLGGVTMVWSTDHPLGVGTSASREDPLIIIKQSEYRSGRVGGDFVPIYSSNELEDDYHLSDPCNREDLYLD